jgi:hypothetical protein
MSSSERVSMTLSQILSALHPDHFQNAEEKLKAEEAFESQYKKMDASPQSFLTFMQSCEGF